VHCQSGNLRFATIDHIGQPLIRMTITPAGQVGIATTTPANIFTIGQGAGTAISDGWDTYSSARWKSNIETYHVALEAITRLRGVTYTQTSDGKRQVGMIAEEVAPVLPEVVSFSDGAPQGIDYSRLTAVLIQAVKEQQEEITRLKARLDSIAANQH
jgi:hypothetical protein